MQRFHRKGVVAVIIGLEAAVGVGLAWINYLFAVWMIDDAVAFAMTPKDWYMVAAKRTAVGMGIAAIFAVGTYWLNRFLWRTHRSWHRFRWTSPVLTALILLSAAIGGIEFLVTKPYM